MNRSQRSLEYAVWGGLLLVVVWVLTAFALSKWRGLGVELPVIGVVPDFALTNQLGQRVALQDLRGKVWIADLVFTRCPGPCAKMTAQMAELQKSLASGDDAVQLVTLTTDPDYDTREVLARYAARFGAQSNRWWFLTGGRTEIRRLAVEGLKLVTQEKAPDERENPADLFIHSTLFVLVDRQGRLRGVFETQFPSDDDGRPAAGADAAWSRTRDRLIAAAARLTAEKAR
jgi:protein SCO1/2